MWREFQNSSRLFGRVRLRRTLTFFAKNINSPLKNIEAEIIAGLGEWCAEYGLYFVSQNDGFVAKKCEAGRIMEQLKRLIFDRFKYYPNIDMKERFIDTTNYNKPPSPTLSYVVHKDSPIVKDNSYKDTLNNNRFAGFADNWRKNHCFLIQDDGAATREKMQAII